MWGTLKIAYCHCQGIFIVFGESNVPTRHGRKQNVSKKDAVKVNWRTEAAVFFLKEKKQHTPEFLSGVVWDETLSSWGCHVKIWIYSEREMRGSRGHGVHFPVICFFPACTVSHDYCFVFYTLILFKESFHALTLRMAYQSLSCMEGLGVHHVFIALTKQKHLLNN